MSTIRRFSRFIDRPYRTAGGQNANVRVRLIKQTITEIRMWGAHERVSVRREGRAEEGKR